MLLSLLELESMPNQNSMGKGSESLVELNYKIQTCSVVKGLVTLSRFRFNSMLVPIFSPGYNLKLKEWQRSAKGKHKKEEYLFGRALE